MYWFYVMVVGQCVGGVFVQFVFEGDVEYWIDFVVVMVGDQVEYVVQVVFYCVCGVEVVECVYGEGCVMQLVEVIVLVVFGVGSFGDGCGKCGDDCFGGFVLVQFECDGGVDYCVLLFVGN